MNILDAKLDGITDGVVTVGDFLKKYAGMYPSSINEDEFRKQLETYDKEMLK